MVSDAGQATMILAVGLALNCSATAQNTDISLFESNDAGLAAEINRLRGDLEDEQNIARRNDPQRKAAFQRLTQDFTGPANERREIAAEIQRVRSAMSRNSEAMETASVREVLEFTVGLLSKHPLALHDPQLAKLYYDGVELIQSSKRQRELFRKDLDTDNYQNLSGSQRDRLVIETFEKYPDADIYDPWIARIVKEAKAGAQPAGDGGPR